MTFTYEEKKNFLKNLVRKYYNQGDSYYAYKSKKDKWHFGYTNDYPLQHGHGEDMILPDRMVDLLIQPTGIFGVHNVEEFYEDE